MQVRVDPAIRDRVSHTADALGVSASAYVEQLLAREQEQLGPDGVPPWWGQQVPADQMELPLKSAS